ncbi:hypothetical protein MTO96_030726, partial [Rhipicephalus appendiculatus]
GFYVQEKESMGGYLATFILAAVVFLMGTMALLVVVFLASSGDEEENTASGVLNNDITDLLERQARGADLNPATPTAKLTAATTTHRSTGPTPSTATSTPPTTTPTTTTPASRTTRKTPRKSLLAGSLLCTLGVIDFSGTYVYPLDGVCDLITFDSLFVGGGITLSPPYNDDFKTFLDTARSSPSNGVRHRDRPQFLQEPQPNERSCWQSDDQADLG